MRNDKGFTLIETIIALMVVAAATVMLMQIYSSVSRGGVKATNILRAVEIARDQLELTGTVHPLTPGDQSGTTADGYLWQLNIQPYGGGEEIDLVRVEAVVRKPGRPEILADLTTLKLVRDGKK